MSGKLAANFTPEAHWYTPEVWQASNSVSEP